MTAGTRERLLIVTGDAPADLVVFAAAELKRYVATLFGIQADIVPAIQPNETSIFLDAKSARMKPLADDQSVLLRRIEHDRKPAFIASGGSPMATLWAVYDLIERWGVTYLLHGDVFPEKPGPFHFPNIDQAFSPNLRVRCWRLINDMVCGPESWGLEENRRFLNQLAKLKHNEILLSFWPWQSYVHYEFRGVPKQTGVSWLGCRYPIDDDTVGREWFGSVKEFENPDLAGLSENYWARHDAARRQVQGILDHARQRGLRTGISIRLLEYPLEFMKSLPGFEVAEQCGRMSCCPSADQAPDSPLLQELVRTIIQAHLQIYPAVEALYLSVPEHRAWMNQAEKAWRHLDAKYGISRVMSFEDAIANAKKRTRVHGGAERQVARVKADLVALWMLDQVLADGTAIERPGSPPPRVIYVDLAEELYPLLPELPPKGKGLMNFTDYTARRVADQIEVLDTVPADKIRCRQIFTLEDDNIGLLPQLATKPFRELAAHIRTRGWEGFVTRFWTIGCHDLTAHYLSRSSWDTGVTPESSCANLIARLCGEACVELMLQAWELIEANTDAFDRYDGGAFDKHGINFAFTVPSMMMKHWDARQPMADAFEEVRRKYNQAWRAVKKAETLTKPTGKTFVKYLLGRLRFGVCYIDAVKAVAAAGVADKEGRKTDTLAEMEKALVSIREAIEAYASVAADNSDRGAVAALNEYCYRPLRNKLAEINQERVLHERTV